MIPATMRSFRRRAVALPLSRRFDTSSIGAGLPLAAIPRNLRSRRVRHKPGQQLSGTRRESCDDRLRLIKMVLETFFWPLILAAISALAFLAYKHPKSFRINIAVPLLGLTIIVIVAVTAWNAGSAGVSLRRMVEEVSQLQKDKILPQHTLESLTNLAVNLKDIYDFQIVVLAIGTAVFIYLLILILLPTLLSVESSEDGAKDS